MCDSDSLTDMMFERKPIEDFYSKLQQIDNQSEWSDFLHLCYFERKYLKAGGDLGYLDDPPIDKDGIVYLDQLIGFLKDNGVVLTIENKEEIEWLFD